MYNCNREYRLMALFTVILATIFMYVTSCQCDKIKWLETENTRLQDQHRTDANTITNLNEDCIVFQNRFYDLYVSEKESEVMAINEIIDEVEDTKTWFILYKKMTEMYGDDFGCPDTVYDCFTEEEINMMWKCIETETYQADFDSKVNVACVILNRVEHDMFPPNPIEIITKQGQFAYGRNIITEDTKLALEYAFSIEDTTNGCIAFRSDIKPNEWNNWEYQFTDNANHHFYK